MQIEMEEESLDSEIPPWIDGGILPPFRVSPAHRAGCSPYECSIEVLVTRFLDEPDGNQNPKRRDLLIGLLNYRTALRTLGFSGFQCLSGSFVEQVESIRGCVHNDIDAVSYLHPPFNDGVDSLTQLLNWLIDRKLLGKKARAEYGVDGYVVILNKFGLEFVVEETHYWYGLFTHQKLSLKWKGIPRVELTVNESEDAAARQIVEEWRSP